MGGNTIYNGTENTYGGAIMKQINEMQLMNMIYEATKMHMTKYDKNGNPHCEMTDDKRMLEKIFSTDYCKQKLMDKCISVKNIQVIANKINWIWVGFPLFNEDELEHLYVLGPFYTSGMSTNKLRDYLAAQNMPLDFKNAIIRLNEGLPVVLYSELLHWVCFLHQFIYQDEEETPELEFFPIEEQLKKSHKKETKKAKLGIEYDKSFHGSYKYEKFLFSAIQEGEYDKVIKGRSKFRGKVGNLSNGDPLRQGKNMVIVLVTLAVRAAMAGGVPPEEAYSLGDYYIQKVENLMDISLIIELKEEILKSMSDMVNEYKGYRDYSKVILDCIEYIERHIEENINSKHVADYAHYHVDYISKKFRKETGMSIVQYITDKKLKISKGYLTYSNYSITEISERLSYSSPSLFATIFKKNNGITPKEYRMKKYEE